MANTNTQKPTSGNMLALVRKDTVDVVAAKVREYQEKGELQFPPNYSPENAMKAAWLKLQETRDKNDKPALQVCTKDSIANALLTMVVYGLTTAKDQGYFIVYGNRLIWQNSYFGNVALWKRVTGSTDDPDVVIVYEGDEFSYEIIDGKYTNIKHKQSITNIKDDINKIIAAYTILTYPDGRKEVTIMTKEQIEKAWNQGQMKGNSPAHKNFPSEMSKKTVINRACKMGIKSSDDSSLKLMKDVMIANENDISNAALEAEIEEEIEENANQEILDIEGPYDNEKHSLDGEIEQLTDLTGTPFE